jgi:hypothetical protein
MFRCFCDRDRKAQRQDDKRLGTIGTYDQEIRPIEPAIEFTEAVGACLHFDTAIDAQERHRHITTETPLSGATERYTFGGKAGGLEQANEFALNACAFVS